MASGVLTRLCDRCSKYILFLLETQKGSVEQFCVYFMRNGKWLLIIDGLLLSCLLLLTPLEELK